MPFDYQLRGSLAGRHNVHHQDHAFSSRASQHLDQVEIVIGCQLQSRWARATSADPRFR